MVDQQQIQLTLPEDVCQFSRLRAGQMVLVKGVLLTARDAAHARLIHLLDNREPLPVDLAGQTIYYTGPTPTPQGKIIGSCGPTTSGRMDGFTPHLLRHGLRGMIGKGPRSPEVIRAIQETQAVYFYAFGGCGALYAQRVQAVEVVGFADLGPEAMYRLQVENFPLVVGVDSLGNSIF